MGVLGTKRSVPGFEPGTSCTQSRNHTTRPNGLIGTAEVYGLDKHHKTKSVFTSDTAGLVTAKLLLSSTPNMTDP
jgi:hypothetical protein